MASTCNVYALGVDPAGKGKKLHTEWKWVFGEMAWDIQIGSFTGQRTVYVVSHANHMLLQLTSSKPWLAIASCKQHDANSMLPDNSSQKVHLQLLVAYKLFYVLKQGIMLRRGKKSMRSFYLCEAKLRILVFQSRLWIGNNPVAMQGKAQTSSCWGSTAWWCWIRKGSCACRSALTTNQWLSLHILYISIALVFSPVHRTHVSLHHRLCRVCYLCLIGQLSSAHVLSYSDMSMMLLLLLQDRMCHNTCLYVLELCRCSL